jgi:threonine dehydrogenase-like Zn-dependent dehydrogenase
MSQAEQKTVVVGVTGASGAVLAQPALRMLEADARVGRIHLVVTDTGALARLRSGRVDPQPLISRIFPLKDAAEAIRYAQRPGVMKVLLRPVRAGSKNIQLEAGG